MRRFHLLIAAAALTMSAGAGADVGTRTTLLTRREWFNAQSNLCRDKFLEAIGTPEQKQQVLLECTKELFKRQNELYPALSSNDVDALRNELATSWRSATDRDPKRAEVLRAEITALNLRYVHLAAATSASAGAAN